MPVIEMLIRLDNILNIRYSICYKAQLTAFQAAHPGEIMIARSIFKGLVFLSKLCFWPLMAKMMVHLDYIDSINTPVVVGVIILTLIKVLPDLA